VRQLRAFVTLADEGSMTAVARALGVAQSTVSEALAALERTLGTSVAVRRPGGHRIALTPAGRALLPHARTLLACMGEAEAAVAAVTRETRGRIEVIANESIGTYLLVAASDLLRRSWPNVRLGITVGTCASVREGVTNDRFDIGLWLRADDLTAVGVPPAPPAIESCDTRTLADVRLVLFSGPDHPASIRKRPGGVPRGELAAYPVFMSDASEDFQKLLSDFFQADAVPSPRLESTGTIEAVKRSVFMNPLALGVLPGYALVDELRGGRIHEVAVRPGLPRVRLEAMLARGRPRHPAGVELIEVLRATLDRSQALGPRARARSRPHPAESPRGPRDA
jgi:DNA-binding transcriptional LysR family regulator